MATLPHAEKRDIHHIERWQFVNYARHPWCCSIIEHVFTEPLLFLLRELKRLSIRIADGLKFVDLGECKNAE